MLLISTGEELSKESLQSDTSCSVVLKKVFVSKESPTVDWLISHLLLLLVAGVGVLHSDLPLVRYLYRRKEIITTQLRKRRRKPKIIRDFGHSISDDCLSRDVSSCHVLVDRKNKEKNSKSLFYGFY